MKTACSTFILLLLGALCGRYAHAQFGDPIGTHRIILVVTKYPNSNDDPQITAAQWQGLLALHVGGYYGRVSGVRSGNALINQSAFQFVAATSFSGVPQFFTLTTLYSALSAFNDFGGTIQNDPVLLFREGREAIELLDAANPDILADPANSHFVIFVNRQKRGMASTVMPFQSRRRGWINLSISVVPEPGAPGNSESERRTVRVQGGNILRDGTDADGNPETVNMMDEITTVCHEVGHLLGLPDLYAEQTGDLPGLQFTYEFNEAWCEMGSDTMQNFGAFSREMTGWCPPGRIAVMTPPAAGTSDTRTFRIFPPTVSTANGQAEILMLPTGNDIRNFSPTMAGALRAMGVNQPFVAFTGYLLEARPKINADATLTADPAGRRFASRYGTLGLPEEYGAGLILTFSKPWVNVVRYAPFHPVEVVPRRRSPAAVGEGLSLAAAAWRPNDTFEDPSRGITIRVLEQLQDGSIRVEVTWAPPPQPDISIVDFWLDNPANGFGSFLTDAIGRVNGVPPLFGDPIFRPTTITWSDDIIPVPSITLGTVGHNLHLRVRNVGAAPIERLNGSVYILEPQLSFNLDLFGGNPLQSFLNWLDEMNPLTTVNVGSGTNRPFRAVRTNNNNAFPLMPGEVADVVIPYTPRNQFLVAAALSPCTSPPPASQVEPAEFLSTNVGMEAMMVMSTAPGSPYSPLEFRLPVKNTNDFPIAGQITVDGIPESVPGNPGWQASIAPAWRTINRWQTTDFRVVVRPPDAPAYKPGQIEPIRMTGWMSYSDSLIPVAEIRPTILVQFRTRLTASLKSETLVGKLEYYDLNGNLHPCPAGLPIVVSATTRDGQSVFLSPGTTGHTAVTSSTGQFTQTIPLLQGKAPGTAAAVAQFGGTEDYQASSSPAVPNSEDESTPTGGLPDLVARFASARLRVELVRGNLQLVVEGVVEATNRGRSASPATTVDFLASSDTTPDAKDRRLGEQSVPRLRPGESAQIRFSFTATRIDPDQRRLLLVIDPKNGIKESDERNNTAAYVPR